MKKTFLFIFAMVSMALGATAQNVQLHYDLGSALSDKLDSRPKLTTTVEMFKADGWGSTYFFIDFDYAHDGVKSGYWEISREFNLGKKGFAAHVEYNGGLNSNDSQYTTGSYNNAYLAGPAFNGHSADFSKTYSIQLMYKYLQGSKYKGVHHSWQLTGVWSTTFAKGACTFSGFMDLWHDNTVSGNLIFVSEPQFWVNLNALKGVNKNFNLSLGSEVELSSNFVYGTGVSNNRVYAIPTLAAKWSF